MQRRELLKCHFLCAVNMTLLSENDLFILLDLLRNAASKWKNIGDALGFPCGELNNISAKPTDIIVGVDAFLREMLICWLKRAPPQHQLPTLEALVQALQAVGEGRMAYNLPQHFWQRKHSAQPAYCIQQSYGKRIIIV